MDRVVAVKLINSDLLTDENSIKRFQQETRARSLFQHKNISGLHDVCVTSSGQPYLVMGYVEEPADPEKSRQETELAVSGKNERRLVVTLAIILLAAGSFLALYGPLTLAAWFSDISVYLSTNSPISSSEGQRAADRAYKHGDYRVASETYRRLYEMYCADGKQETWEALSVEKNLAISLYKTGQKQESDLHFKKACQELLALANRDSNQSGKAERRRCMLAALELTEQVEQRDSALYSSILAVIGKDELNDEQFLQAAKHLQLALECSAKLRSDEDIEICDTRVKLAEALFHLDKLVQAKSSLLAAIAWLQKQQGDRAEQMLASVYYKFGVVCTKQGNLDEALPAYRKSVALYDRFAAVSPANLDLANVLYQQSHYREAMPYARKWLRDRLATLDYGSQDTLSTIDWFSEFCLKTGNFEEVEPLYKKEIAALTQAHKPTTQAVLSLGYRYEVVHKYLKEEQLFSDFVRNAKDASAQDRTVVLIRLGEARTAKIDYKNAEKAFKEALASYERQKLNDPEVYYHINNDLGTIYELLGNYASALQCFTQLFNYCQSKFGPDAEHTLRCRVELSTTNNMLGNYDTAIKLAKSALQKSHDKSPTSYFVIGPTRVLMFAYEGLGDYQSAIKFANDLWPMCIKSDWAPVQKLELGEHYQHDLLKLNREEAAAKIEPLLQKWRSQLKKAAG